MPLVYCTICAREFYRKPSALKVGAGKYCSMACKRAGQRTGKLINCFICGKEVYKTGKAIKGSQSGAYFCGKSCQTTWRNTVVYVGARHHNWKGGAARDSYRSIIRRSDKKRMCNYCGLADVRILLVHHIDHNHLNNALQNLAWLCHNCHYLIHHYREENKKFMADVA